MNIALIGCGIIGNALKEWIKKNNPSVMILVNDPVKGYYDDVYDAKEKIDAFFVQIHVKTNSDGTQHLDDMISIIRKIPKNIPIWVRTTLSQQSLKTLRTINSNVEFLPEFLTERTAIEDFEKQKMIFTGNINLLKDIFIGKDYIEMTSEEAIMAKYSHNVFGAMKVTYFNCIRDLCEKSNLDFSNVLNGILASGYISDNHTHVPGPDGKLGYGGKCFPKDVNSFIHENKGTILEKLIGNLPDINSVFRK